MNSSFYSVQSTSSNTDDFTFSLLCLKSKKRARSSTTHQLIDRCLSRTLLSDENEREVYYGIAFQPPIPLRLLPKYGLRIQWAQRKRIACKPSQLILPIGGGGEEGRREVLIPGEREYLVFPTHQLWIEGGDAISALYLRLENNRLYSNRVHEVFLNVGVDISHAVLERLFSPTRWNPLPYFPPDLSVYDMPPELAAARPPESMPQKIPYWYDIRDMIEGEGEEEREGGVAVSGSKSYTLMGFYVPLKDPSWSFFAPKTFDDFQRCRVRFGALSEEVLIASYLSRFPQRSLYEKGSCRSASMPPGWSASPDGLCHDPSVTEKDLAGNGVDLNAIAPDRIEWGAMEFKATNTAKDDGKLKAYYFPQVYMEMMALEVGWCDLVRYRRRRIFDTRTRRYTYEHLCIVYRIHRHAKTEKALMDCLRYAAANAHSLQRVVAEPAFVRLRNYFEECAKTFTGTKIPVDDRVAAQIDRARKTLPPFQPIEEEDEEEEEAEEEEEEGVEDGKRKESRSVWDDLHAGIDAMKEMEMALDLGQPSAEQELAFNKWGTALIETLLQQMN